MISFAFSRQLAESSPYFEDFKRQNKEVLFLHDAADELVMLMMNQIKGKNVVSVEEYLKREGLHSDSDKSGECAP